MEYKLLLALDIETLKERVLILIKMKKPDVYKYYRAYTLYPELRDRIKILLK